MVSGPLLDVFFASALKILSTEVVCNGCLPTVLHIENKTLLIITTVILIRTSGKYPIVVYLVYVVGVPPEIFLTFLAFRGQVCR